MTDTHNKNAWNRKNIERITRECAASNDYSVRESIHTIRFAVTGTTVGPGLFGILELLGKETVIRRLRRAVEYIHNKDFPDA